MKSENINLLNDIYYTEEYANLYVDDNSSLFHFEYREGGSLFINIAIKSPIDRIGLTNCNEGYYDLETPYGYGGFYTNTKDVDFVGRAVEKYRKRCLEENIIAEFIRFHPFNPFPHEFSNKLDFYLNDRKTVYVNLNLSYNEIIGDYVASLKRNIRKAITNNLVFALFEKNKNNIKKFIDLYYLTMKKHEAKSMYFFEKKYFYKIFSLDNIKLYGILAGNVVINMILILESNNFVYYHLGATDPEYYSYNPNPFIFDRLIEMYNKSSFKILFLGGGATNEPNDSLLRFKQKYSKLTKPFYIAGMIYNRDKYQEYVHKWESHNEGKGINYFLKYRLTDR